MQRKMARFSVGGDEDGNEEGPSNNRPLAKRSRLLNHFVQTHRRTVTSGTSISDFGGRATTSAAAEVPRPDEPVAVQEESEERSSDESEASWSHSSSESEEESDEEERAQEDQAQEEQQNQRSGNEVQSTERRVDSTQYGDGTCRESEAPIGFTVTLTDPDVLDCPICYEPLFSPVYQCENGHIACATCCTKLKNKCGSCCWPIGYNRCRAMEKVLDSVRIACRNMPYGCMDTLSYSMKHTHEKRCSYAPCSCPFTGCDYVAISNCLYTHFGSKHSHSSKRFIFNAVTPISLHITQKHVFLQEVGHHTLFILNRSIETGGSSVNVVCVGPISERRLYMYEVTATAGDSSIKLKTFVDVMPKWTAQSPKELCLIIPGDFFSINEQLKLELIIRRNPAVRR